MSLPKFASPICLLTFALVLQAAFGGNPLGQFCSNDDNFTANTPYEANLNTLMGYLYFSTPMTGVGLGVIGQSPNRVYGLASCGAKISSADCKTCVVDASAQIHKSCPNGKQAKVWYDKCFLKYSEENFFGQIDNSEQILMWNVQNASDPLTFNGKTKELLGKLAKEASETSKFYAAGELGFQGHSKIYGLAQCTRDLSCGDCYECLNGLIGELPNCCDGKQGARILGGSCSIRYEMYPFVGV